MIFPGGSWLKSSADWDYVQLKHEGSHIIVQTETPSRQRIPVPDHNPLRLGTLNSILRFVSRHKGVDREDLLSDIT